MFLIEAFVIHSCIRILINKMNIKLDHTLVSYTLQEYMEENNLTQKKLAEATGIHRTRINEIIKGKQRMTIEFAIRIGHYTGTNPKYWLNLQTKDDLLSISKDEEEKIKKSITPMERDEIKEVAV